MSKSTILSLLVVFGLSVLAGFFLFHKTGSFGASVPEVDWRLLGDWDYVTAKGTKELEAFDEKEVRIAGFMVPLEDDMKAVTAFLLVPTPQACIHVPPPPPNQMVLVEMDASKNEKVHFGPIWIYGKLSLKPKKHMYGESSFTMTGTAIEPYQ